LLKGFAILHPYFDWGDDILFAIPTTLTVAFVALAVERFLGFPSPLRRSLGHPVNWLYRLNGVFSALVPDDDAGMFRRKVMGAAFCVLSVGVAVALASIATSALRGVPYAWFWEGVLATPFLAQYALRVRARAVASELETNNLLGAQQALTHLVNHDLSQLDESHVARGCLEAVAENIATAIVTPAFWLALFGLPGIIAISALSAVHRRLSQDRDARRFCDLVETAANFLPARLAGLLIAGAASMTSPSGGARALETIWRDSGKSSNLTSSWPESAVSGALDVRLGGPRQYGDLWVERDWVGDGTEHLDATDLRSGLKLLAQTLTLLTVLVGIAAAFA
jgi:adenosylcobinamide-phosphate synthase